MNNSDIFYEKVLGSRTFKNYVFLTLLFLGSIGFSIVGISSFLNFNLVNFLKSDMIIFFPQGLVMCFYGVFGFLFSIYQWFLVYLKVGEGYVRIIY
jgi:hypothetical protein